MILRFTATSVFMLLTIFNIACSQDCLTPIENKQGTCISLEECTFLFTLYSTRRQSKSVTEFLRKSHVRCNLQYLSHIPKVCCQRDGLLEQVAAEKSALQFSDTNEVTRFVSARFIEDDSVPSPKGICGNENNGEKIYGGTATELDEFPWMAQLGYRKPDTRKLLYACGGMLLNRRYVLTAAHCIENDKRFGTLETVRLGEYDIRTEVDCRDDVCADPLQDILVESAYAHSGYVFESNGRKYINDIGIIRMAARANFTSYVKPVCLPDALTRLDTGGDVVVAGWGYSKIGKKPDVKQKVTLPVFDRDICLSLFKDTMDISMKNMQICAGGVQGKDACMGDSGGPLMRMMPSGEWEAVGVVSYGYRCGQRGWPGVYTFIPSYRDWILNMMITTNNPSK